MDRTKATVAFSFILVFGAFLGIFFVHMSKQPIETPKKEEPKKEEPKKEEPQPRPLGMVNWKCPDCNFIWSLPEGQFPLNITVISGGQEKINTGNICPSCLIKLLRSNVPVMELVKEPKKELKPIK